MTTQRALIEAWAANAVIEIRTLGDAQLSAWIVDRRVRIATCAREAPEAVKRVRAALADRDRELRAETVRQGIG